MTRISPRALLLCLIVLTGPATTAQNVYCGPGTRVDSQNGGSGTIQEIGTESPHVGWYRVSFSWSPRGEWYEPSTWNLYVAGTRQRCSPQRQAAPPAPRPEPPTAAGPGACAIGTRVVGEHGGGTGTIAEVGTEPPHVGWYRVTFSWSPRGEWYDPRTWTLNDVATGQRCRTSPVSDDEAPRPAPRPEPDDDDEPAPVRVPRPRPQPTAAPRTAGGSLPAGRYTCSMPGAGQFPITIADADTYSDRGGQSGRYRVDGDQITFESGSLRGTFSRILGPGKFGLSLDQNSSFYGVCNLKR